MSKRLGFTLSILACLSIAATCLASGESPEEIGRRIYQEGLLPSGQPLRAVVEGDVSLEGRRAACISCHRRSGLGNVEGGDVVPPITGRALFAVPDAKNPFAVRLAHPPYNDSLIDRALRHGIDAGGKPLKRLMPRYALDDSARAALIAYLKSIGNGPAPGVASDQIHLATVIADDVPASERSAILGVLEAYITDHNAGIRNETRRGERAVFGHSRMYRAYRKWNLHVWDLHGSPSTWDEQLQKYYAAQPVFAVIGGRARGPWAPVHHFCDKTQVPCLFPVTDLPPAETSFYSLYFSRGLYLEADVVASKLRAQHPKRVVQVFREGDDGQVAATALKAACPELTFEDRAIRANEKIPPNLLHDVDTSADVALVMWLRSDDVTALPKSTAARFLSGTMLDDQVLKPGLANQAGAFVVDPYDLPATWAQKRTRIEGWLKQRGHAMSHERLQADSYFAITSFGTALNHIRENFSREYLVERMEHTLENSVWPSVYPRLALGPDQRFASKGANIVWISKEGPESRGWVIPAE